MDNDINQKELAKNAEKAKEALEKAIKDVTDKEIVTLTAEDKEFLYARRSYLSREQRGNYKQIFAEVEQAHSDKLAKEAKGNVKEQNTGSGNTNPHPADGDDDLEDEEDLDNVNEDEIG